MAHSLRDLADALGIDRNGLEQTVALVNALAFEDDMDDFGRSFHASQMMLGPYLRRAGHRRAAGHGGRTCDRRERSRACGRTAATLPNLLAAGGAARGISGDAGGGYLEGNGLLAAVVGGYLAGRTAAELAYSKLCRPS